MDEQATMWRGWQRDIVAIQPDVEALHRHRALWHELVDAVEAAGVPGRGAVLDAVTRMYACQAAATIERLAATSHHTRNLTLAILIEQIHTDNETLTRERFLSHPGASDELWTQHAGGGAALDKAFSRKDYARLQTETGRIPNLRLRAATHSAVAPDDAVPTFGQLDEPITVVTELWSKYAVLLLGPDYGLSSRAADTTSVAVLRAAFA